MKEEELLNSLRSMQNLSDKMIKEILETKYEHANLHELKNFANFVVMLIDTLGKQGHVYNIIALNYVLIEKLSPRFGIHRFSQREMDDQNEDYFEYFMKIDNAFGELTKIDLSDHSKQILKIQNLFDEIPPISITEKKTNDVKSHYRRKTYFTDYLTCISDFYESFLLFCLYILILLKLLSKDNVSKYLQDLSKGKKLTVNQIYSDKNRNEKKKEKLIYEYLIEFPLQEDPKKSLIDLFEKIFGDEGIRDLRNKKIHHYGEDNIQFIDNNYLEVKYKTGATKRYTLKEIHIEKINIQFIVYLGFFIAYSSFLNMFYQLIEKDFNKKKK